MSIPSNAEAFLGMGLGEAVLGKGFGNASIKSCASTSDSPPSNKQNHRYYKNIFKPQKWTLRRAPSLPNNSSSLKDLLQDASLELPASKRVKKDLEELTAATWNRDKRIALLDPSEIKIVHHQGNNHDQRICSVESITLEKTAEYLQQEAYRLQLHTKSKNNQLYSLKRIPPSKTTSASSTSTGRTRRKGLRLLVQEATILTKLGEHPNIVSLRGLPFQSCSISGFFLLTDRLHEDTLETRIQQWQKEGQYGLAATSSDPYVELYGGDEDTIATPNDDTIPRKTNYALQIAKALQACHNAGIVVRGLSPQTIGFRQDDPHCVQLVDLGHAQQEEEALVDDPTTANKACLVGKRRYLAGEIWKTGRYSRATDVYGWAMVYYEMCMERKPFLGYSVSEHQTNVWEKGDRPLLASCYLPQGIDRVLASAWAHRPEERSTIDEVCHQTQTVLMQLDSCLFWDHHCDDGEFLFDVVVELDPDDDDDDEISELGDRWEEDSVLLGGVESILLEHADELSVSDCFEDEDETTISTSCGSEKPQQGSVRAKHIRLISSAA